MALKVSVDTDICSGHGRCYVLAPDVFGADDRGHCEIISEIVDDALADKARIGQANCPEGAISVTEA